MSTHRFQSNFAQGAGKEQADAAAAEDAMIRRYLEKQAQAIEDRHRSDLAKIADTNAKIKAENDSQMARKARDRAAAAACLLYTSPSPRDGLLSRMPSSA